MRILEIYVGNSRNERLDFYLSKEIEDISRTYIHRLIKDGLVLVNGKQMKPRYIVRKGDFIQIKLPSPKQLELVAEDIPIDIIYEDKDILIVNKPQGMVVHPAPGNYSKTLVNALLFHIEQLSTINGMVRPGIIHRLDKDTSGLLIVAKNDMAHKKLSEQLKERAVMRKYMALVHGILTKSEGTIDAPIGRNPVDRKKMTVIYKNSKEAITNYKVLEKFKGYSLLEVALQTGRTHQIRVHMAYINHPIVGDRVYCNRENELNIDKQLLHARKLGFFHPRTGEYIEFEAELPKVFKNILDVLRGRKSEVGR